MSVEQMMAAGKTPEEIRAAHPMISVWPDYGKYLAAKKVREILIGSASDRFAVPRLLVAAAMTAYITYCETFVEVLDHPPLSILHEAAMAYCTTVAERLSPVHIQTAYPHG